MIGTSLRMTAFLSISMAVMVAGQDRAHALPRCRTGTAVSRGWTTAFNGYDLSGWVVEGTATFKENDAEKPVWYVEDGKIICAGKGFGFLRYDKSLCDFSLYLEFRMSEKCNSGIGIRADKFAPKRSDTRPSISGFEIQILDDAGKEPDVHSSMSLYRYVAPLKNAIKPAGEWNWVQITARGTHIRVVLNGQVVQDLDQTEVEKIKDKPLCGFFSVQNHGGYIEFRNIFYKELAPTIAAHRYRVGPLVRLIQHLRARRAARAGECLCR
ncbi:MAG: 3-keto-disaccharide hydrolase [Thermogutta sp.]